MLNLSLVLYSLVMLAVAVAVYTSSSPNGINNILSGDVWKSKEMMFFRTETIPFVPKNRPFESE